MIPIVFAGILIVIDFVLMVYCFCDIDNRVFMNIFSLLMATLISFLLANSFFAGSIVDVTNTINNTAFNSTSEITTYFYDQSIVSYSDGGLGYLFLFVGVSQFVIMLYLGLEGWYESKEEQEEEELTE